MSLVSYGSYGYPSYPTYQSTVPSAAPYEPVSVQAYAVGAPRPSASGPVLSKKSAGDRTQAFISSLREAQKNAKKYWNPGMNTGVWMVDDHNQILFAIIQKLNLLEPEDDNAETIATVLENLQAYTRYHFRTEERLFQAHGIQENRENHDGHTAFTDGVTKFQNKLKTAAYNPGLRFELLEFLNGWWARHILGVDIVCSRQVLALNPSAALPPPGLQQQLEDVRIAFDVFDVNGDGVLDKDEVAHVLELLGQSSNVDEVKALFTVVDLNKDGRLQFNEFVNAFGKVIGLINIPTYSPTAYPTNTYPALTIPTYPATVPSSFLTSYPTVTPPETTYYTQPTATYVSPTYVSPSYATPQTYVAPAPASYYLPY